MTDAKHFMEHGCTLVKDLIDQNTISVVSRYFENKIRRGEWVQGTEGGSEVSRFAYYADPLVEVILEESCSAIEELTGRTLLPTYSYCRVYQPGEALKPHVDRPSCEVSVTVNVATKGEPSPIYTQFGNNDPEKHILNPGDALVYMGCDVMHWRQPLSEEQLNVQFMLHYVSKDGPNATYNRDTRPALGYSADVRS